MYARKDLIVRTEIIKFTARLVKSIAIAGIENKTIAAATGMFGDKGLEKVNDFISNLNYEVDSILNEKELKKLGVPKNQVKDIRERLLGFLGEVELSDIASVAIYDPEKMAEKLWKKYCEYLEDPAPEGSAKTVLFSISVKSIQVLKQNKNFISDSLIRVMRKIENDPGSYSPVPTIRREKEEQQILLLNREVISANQESLKNETILPWMKHSLSYRAVFPEIFIDPILYGNKISGQITYKQLLEKYQDKNLVLTGEAGAGKSTLMRHIYLENNPDCTFLYLKAGALVKKYEDLSLYEQGAVSLLHGEQDVERHRVILLDEMDETFINSMNDLEKVLKKLFRKPEGISIWFGWRSEHFSQKLTPEIQSFLYDILEIHRWDEDLESVESIENPAKSMVFSYVLQYEKITDSRGLCNRFKELVKNDEKVYEIAKTPINLVLLLYLLEEKNRGKKNDEKINTENLNLYSLYDQFFMCWVQREKGRGTSSIHMEQIKKELQQAADYLQSQLYESSDEFLVSNYDAIARAFSFDRGFPSIGNTDEETAAFVRQYFRDGGRFDTALSDDNRAWAAANALKEGFADYPYSLMTGGMTMDLAMDGGEVRNGFGWNWNVNFFFDGASSLLPQMSTEEYTYGNEFGLVFGGDVGYGAYFYNLAALSAYCAA